MAEGTAGDGGVERDAVHRVIRAAAEHADGWEQATAMAVAELAGTIADLRLATVVDRRVAVGPDGTLRYGVTLSLAYRVDRRRTLPGGTVATVQRILLVANRTAGGDELMAEVARRLESGPCEFHVLVPVLVPPSGAGATAWGEPIAGDEQDAAFAWAAAEERLQRQLALLRAAGAMATGELRPADPLKATVDVPGRASFDAIIVSTLPVAPSRWLRLDLPSRLARHTELPIAHIEQGRVGLTRRPPDPPAPG
ncbi:MAG: dodecin domain-containing protein [Acidimicrobiales bacterium]